MLASPQHVSLFCPDPVTLGDLAQGQGSPVPSTQPLLLEHAGNTAGQRKTTHATPQARDDPNACVQSLFPRLPV